MKKDLSISLRIRQFNEGRDTDTLSLKYKLMRQNSFSFFRGTAHIFFEDYAQLKSIHDSSLVWICGDLHLANFGSYRGDNKEVYFDINDFDEAMIAPLSFDISRVLTSILVSAKSLKIQTKSINKVFLQFLETYISTITKEKPATIERHTATGLFKKFLTKVENRKEKDFLKDRIKLKKDGSFRIIIDGQHTLEIDENKKAEITELLKNPEKELKGYSFKILDIARRIAGTGSLGLERYVLLVKEISADKKIRLLDLKKAKISCFNALVKNNNPAFPSEAERVIEAQRNIQQVSPAILYPVVQNNQNSFILRELQPTEDKIVMESLDLKKLSVIIETLAQITASGHIRGCGRRNCSTIDDLVDLVKTETWQNQVIAFAREYSQQVLKDYEIFSKDYDQGFFNIS
ncbi:Uncharacterized conserved protein, DUF2252 family [Pseudarcicella hirudinis]|uniref:Uncharacterized conserved protein, DUF2252 family n=1 Tax=Pseudarcicella hirudinis TaxID=1079859 RepID=A0A1I5X923_9BACT|nr:DUF2252 family protein [Pseudarcicella hirudinis]SFQ28479.1 Uncharacterized conserved protein, DUF2252 family [Pseudarcicella hirudinis]